MKQCIYKWYVYCCPFFRLGEFVSGMVAGVFYVNHSKDLNKSTTLLEVAAIFYLGIAYLMWKMAYNEITYFFITILTIPLFFVFPLEKGRLSIFLKNKYIVLFGNLSPYLFLLHQIVIKYIDKIFGLFSVHKGELVKFLMAASSLLLSFVLSVLYVKIVKGKSNRASGSM